MGSRAWIRTTEESSVVAASPQAASVSTAPGHRAGEDAPEIDLALSKLVSANDPCFIVAPSSRACDCNERRR